MIELDVAEQLAFDGAVGVRTRRDLLIVAGPDAAEYLHGQVSQNVTGLAVGETARTLLLQPQGKVDAWGRLHRRGPEEFWFDVEKGHGEEAKARLERFKLRVDATIELSTVDVVAVRGPRSAELAPGDSSAGSAGEVAVVGLAWVGLDGFDLFPTDPSATPAMPDGLAEGPAELLDVLRVTSALPAMGPELDGDTIPAAARVVDVSVDFTKGCYVGQELVARVDSRGSNTPTRLYSLRFDGDAAAGDAAAGDSSAASAVEAGAELLDGDDIVGRVTTAAMSARSGAVGLGYLKRAVSIPADLTVRTPDGNLVPVRADEPGAPS